MDALTAATINNASLAGPSFSPITAAIPISHPGYQELPAVATMRISTAASLLFGSLRAAACPAGSPAVDDFIEAERVIALEQLLCNIGADGCNAAGVSPGIVVASPSKSDPDCMMTPLPQKVTLTPTALWSITMLTVAA